jgi:hypothetical protein
MEMADAGEGVGEGAPPPIVEITYCCPSADGRNRIEADIAAAFLRHPEITAATHWTIRIRLRAFGVIIRHIIAIEQSLRQVNPPMEAPPG